MEHPEMQERGLTWSKKWHIINPDHPNASRYAIALCGAYVYRNDDPKYPSDLKAVRDSQRKDTGLCKLCAKSAKIPASVEYPETHQTGSVEVNGGIALSDLSNVDFGLQVARDGRVWVCIDGVAFIRFKPHRRSSK